MKITKEKSAIDYAECIASEDVNKSLDWGDSFVRPSKNQCELPSGSWVRAVPLRPQSSSQSMVTFRIEEDGNKFDQDGNCILSDEESRALGAEIEERFARLRKAKMLTSVVDYKLVSIDFAAKLVDASSTDILNALKRGELRRRLVHEGTKTHRYIIVADLEDWLARGMP